MKTNAWAALSAERPLEPFVIERREVGPHDVQLEVLFSGICHSDVHQGRGEWGNSKYPMVPGHEIVGRVTAVGAHVKRFKTGELVGVGCMVDSCRTCGPCASGDEQFCEQGCAWTYNGTEMDRQTPTHGGYSKVMVVTEAFVVKVPRGIELSSAAPLLCAGITTWSPLREWNCKKGDRVGVVGLGGLGHMAVKLAAAMGAEVTVLSTSRTKQADAMRLGAHAFEVTSDAQVFARLARRFDLIIDTVSAPHEVTPYMSTLRPRGAMVLVGLPTKPMTIPAGVLVGGNRRLTGSSIGGIRATQEMLNFCAEHHLGADVEVIAAKDINVAWERLVKNDVRYRFVIDGATL